MDCQSRCSTEYELVKQHDILNQQAVNNSGRTVNVSLASVEGVAHPAILAHAHKWGMEHTLATMHLESPLNSVHRHLSLPKRPVARVFGA